MTTDEKCKQAMTRAINQPAATCFVCGGKALYVVKMRPTPVPVPYSQHQVVCRVHRDITVEAWAEYSNRRTMAMARNDDKFDALDKHSKQQQFARQLGSSGRRK